MNKKELIEKLESIDTVPESEIIIPVFNGHVTTYGLVDDMFSINYDALSNDFFGTPGRMDRRMLEIGKGIDPAPDVLLLSSRFGEIPSKEIDFGNDEINYPIKTLNGPGGDEALVFHMNNFEEHGKVFIRHFGKDNFSFVLYRMFNDLLEIENFDDNLHFKGTVIGIEDLRNICKCCKVPFDLWV